MKSSNPNFIKLLTAVTFITMIAANALANILPINGVNTGQVSDNYGNLFAPAGLTFAIWGVIYLLLLLFTIYQLDLFKDKYMKTQMIRKIGILFSISSIANTVWIFAWHYDFIAFSLLLMLDILGCLILIKEVLRNTHLSRLEHLLVDIPFSVYFGWITIATIANVTTLLVQIGWNGFGLSEELWTILILVIGMIITSLTLLRNKDLAYGLVPVWAYIGILIKHTSSTGFSNMYPNIITTVVVCLVTLVLANLTVVFRLRKRAQ